MGMQLINIMLEAAGESLGSFPSLVTVCQVKRTSHTRESQQRLLG